jgi:hypothetical protein
MTIDAPRADPALRTITVRLRAAAALLPDEARHELALSVLAAALAVADERVPPAWTVRAVQGGVLLYLLMPLSGQMVSAAAGWTMTHALRAQPQVAWAEPEFR